MIYLQSRTLRRRCSIHLTDDFDADIADIILANLMRSNHLANDSGADIIWANLKSSIHLTDDSGAVPTSPPRHPLGQFGLRKRILCPIFTKSPLPFVNTSNSNLSLNTKSWKPKSQNSKIWIFNQILIKNLIFGLRAKVLRRQTGLLKAKFFFVKLYSRF